jgi:hypothetical protein
MNYLIATAITAFLALPQVNYPPHAPIVDAVLPTQIQKLELPAVMTRIAECESNNKHFDEDGNVLIGDINKHDIGKFQINALYWDEEADSLGLDIYSEEGNEAFALELYDRYGTKPWKWSKKCWNK